MHRFLVTFSLNESLSISEETLYHQIAHVFRARKGDRIILFSTGGADTIYEVTDIQKKKINLQKVEVLPLKNNKTSGLKVFQAYPHKIQTLELLVQKFVELGIQEVVFFRGKYSQVGEISAQKKARIRAIADEALEQSGGNVPINIVYSSDTLEKLLQNEKDTLHIVGHPIGSNVEPESKNTKQAFWIGPEGGWSPEELTVFEENRAYLWCFNENILRLETAAIVGVGILSYLSR